MTTSDGVFYLIFCRVRAKFVIFALAALVTLGESTRQAENSRLVRSPGPVIDTRIFGNWILIQNTTASNASDAKFMDYLECQKIPNATAVKITKATEGRLITTHDDGMAMGISLTVLTPGFIHGDQIALPEFRFNDRFAAKWFSKTAEPAFMDMVVVRDCYYPAGGTSDVNICGFRHITYPFNATDYYEEYTYRCSDDGQWLTISYLTHECGPATRTYKRQKLVDIERPINDRIFKEWQYTCINITNFQNFLICTGQKAENAFWFSRLPIFLQLERTKEGAVEATYNIHYEITKNMYIRPEFLHLLYKKFRLNERFTQPSIMKPNMNIDVVFERYCYMAKSTGAEECGLRQLNYDAGGTRYTSALTYTMTENGENLRVVMETPNCTATSIEYTPRLPL